MEIQRDTYLNKLIDHRGNGMIKIVTGLRRAGKSYLLLKLFHRRLVEQGFDPAHLVEIPLDDRSFRHLRDPDLMLAFVKKHVADAGPYLLIIDEVQLLPEFEDVLNSFLHIQNLDVYVSGSNSRFLSSDVITEFRGRGDEIRVHPLSFREFMSVYDGPEDWGWQEYFTFGGMPLVAAMSNPAERATYLQALFKQVYLTDIVERNHVRNREELDILVNILASAVGSLTNPKKLADAFRSMRGTHIAPATLKRYCGYLEDAFLIARAERYDIKGKRYIATPSKYYFEDVGLRNARLNFRQQEENHIMENIIHNELKVRGYSVDVGVLEHNGKDANGNSRRRQLEVDFVANRGNQRYYIQSALVMASPDKVEQEQRPLRNIPDSFRKIIVVRDNIVPVRNEQGILTIGIRQFLLDENSLDL